MTTTVYVLARTLHIGSAMMLVALPVFVLLTLKPIFTADTAGDYSSFCRVIVQWIWAAFIGEAVSGLAWFWFVTAQMSDRSPWQLLSPGDLETVLWQTQFGHLWLGRLGLGLALGVNLCVASRPGARVLPRQLLSGWLMAGLNAVLLVTLAWAGHAGAGTRYHALHLIADTLHLLAGAVWPMGLVPLSYFLGHVHQSTQIVPSRPEMEILQRFSRMSLWAVLILVATGIVNSWLMLGTWADFVTTTYGTLLLLKISVVAGMIALGAGNRLRLLPAMRADPAFFRPLRAMILAESALILVVLLIVGTMGMTTPPS